MPQGDQQRLDGPAQARAGLIRGVLVILTAVLVGGFVLAQGLDDDPGTEAVAADDSATTGDTTPTSEPDSSVSEPSVGSEAAGNDLDTGDSPVDSMADDESVDTEAADGTATTEAAAGAGTTEASADPSTETTEPPAGPDTGTAGESMVLVLNGAGTKGIAGRGSEVLDAAGFEVLAPKNADRLGDTEILYTDGFEGEAVAVADALGVSSEAVVAPLDPSNPPIADVRDATVIVVIGQDGLIDV